MRESRWHLASFALRGVLLVALVCTIGTPGRGAPSGPPARAAEQGGTAPPQTGTLHGQQLAPSEVAGPDQHCVATDGGTSSCAAAAGGSAADTPDKLAGAHSEPAPSSKDGSTVDALSAGTAASATGGQEQHAGGAPGGSTLPAADGQLAPGAADAALQQAAADSAAAEQAQQQEQQAQPGKQTGPASPAADAPAPPPEERHNFALSKDGAKVLATNKEAKKASALLDDDPDTFLKNDCRAEAKWVMLELSQVAKINRLELSQNELYSARVHEFEVLGRQSHPRTDGVGSDYARSLNSSQWKLLGNFTAEKVKGSQMFVIDRPHWVRYLLLRFLSQHGGEAVCALNSVGAFGKSAVEELEDQLAAEERLGLLPPELDVSAPAPGPAADALAPAPAPAQDDPLVAEAPPAAPADTPATQQAGDARQVPPPQQQQEQQQQQHAQEARPPLPSSGVDGGAALASEASSGALAGAASTAQPSPANLASLQQHPPQLQPQQQQQEKSQQQQPPHQPPQQHPATAAPTSTASNASGDSRSSNLTAPSNAGSKEPIAAGQPSQPQPVGRQPGADGQAATRPGSSSQPATRKHKVLSTVMPKRVTHAVVKQLNQQPESPQLLSAGSSAAGAGISSGSQPQAAAPPSEAAASPAAPSPAQQQEQQQPQVSSPVAASNAPTVPPLAARPGAAAASPPVPPGSGAEAEEVLELPLARLTAKGKSGGSVYELLVQEIKSAKLQHKLLAKSVAEVARNASAAYSELAGDLASLAAAVAKIPAERNSSEEALAVQVDALVKAHLLQVSQQMLGLQAALASAAKQQHALLCFLAMMGGVLALNGTRFAEQWPRAKWAVLLLAAANGLVGALLQLQGSVAARPGYWLQALPGWAQ